MTNKADKLIEIILEERKIHGSYLHFQDFIECTNVSQKQLDTLVSIGAFRFTGKQKAPAMGSKSPTEEKPTSIASSAGIVP